MTRQAKLAAISVIKKNNSNVRPGLSQVAIRLFITTTTNNRQRTAEIVPRSFPGDTTRPPTDQRRYDTRNRRIYYRPCLSPPLPLPTQLLIPPRFTTTMSRDSDTPSTRSSEEDVLEEVSREVEREDEEVRERGLELTLENLGTGASGVCCRGGC